MEELEPGPKWSGLFAEYWPAYRKWWAREGLAARPTYAECRKAIRLHMPEIAELYDQLCEAAGGSDNAARFLSFLRPPRYLAGCSQAVWQGGEPLLVRNYDYDPQAFDAVLLKTGWLGRGVIGVSDGLFGLIDGMNDAGLAISLTFGGRREVGEGFGVPLILRYILQTCRSVPEAEAVLRRMPCHMSYNVTVLDSSRRFITVYLAPDRKPVVTRSPVATNHQERVEWSSHARFTATVEREEIPAATFEPTPGDGSEIRRGLSEAAALFHGIFRRLRHDLYCRLSPLCRADVTQLARHHLATGFRRV